jgi:flagellar biogenesis protein FliO
MMEPFLAVVLVLCLLCGVLYFLRSRGGAMFHLPRMTPGVGQRKLEVLERVSLGPQHGLHVVRVGNRSVVIATAPSSCGILCDLATGEAELKKT